MLQKLEYIFIADNIFIWKENITIIVNNLEIQLNHVKQSCHVTDVNITSI